ncbi:MAG: iron ABC transporter permease [Armatimonadetes bacterium]|nr:iron chelate uptake ABC transporter family permease subunit [Armatimonadota bacterium]MBS1703853.1 iron ABC transporter permease [Armatimonadota bacterium]MBS1726230.1 iron ABC transporter permease [Armatimonadota bacterium]
MQKSSRILLVVAFCALVFAFLLHIGLGTNGFTTPLDVARELLRGNRGDTAANSIVWTFRLTRATQGVLVGAILGVSGAALQTLFRNPIAEPYIIGASSGAAVGAAVVNMLGFGFALFGLAMPIAGFVTGLASLMLVTALARRRGVVETPTLLLAGVVVSTMLSSVLSFIILFAGRDQGQVLRWLMGGIDGAFWPPTILMAVVFAISFGILYRSSARLNALSLGEEAAQSLGVNPHRMRALVLVCVTAMVSATVGPVGIIGFVGLVAPHMARKIVGVDLRASLPLSGMMGALLLLLADTIAQRGNQGSGYPVGVITSILGAPVLLLLLKRR